MPKDETRKEKPGRPTDKGPGREAKVGSEREFVGPEGRRQVMKVSEVRRHPSGVVVVIEHGREVG